MMFEVKTYHHTIKESSTSGLSDNMETLTSSPPALKQLMTSAPSESLVEGAQNVIVSVEEVPEKFQVH
uniref:Uncharacterized protein n=1 Tax=Triticum urartu TaxID=4572 RepID=A0A8R7TE75_TRIUA